MKSSALYTNKQKWKIALAIVALLIIIVSLWYTNYLTSKIQKDERLRVKLWSETVKKQAQLVNLTNQTFDQLRTEERKNIELWVKALKEFEREQNDYTFVGEIVQDNISIPLILEFIDQSNTKDITLETRNLPFSSKDFSTDSLYTDSLRKLISQWDEQNERFFIKNSIGNVNQLNIIHYGNSKLFSELKNKSDSLITSFNNELIKNTALVPVVFIDSNSKKLIASNLPTQEIDDSAKIEKVISQMAKENKVISVSLGDGITGKIYYFESQTLKQIRYYLWVQLTIIILFLVIAYVLFSTFRKAEQNQVWAGMAKETAHQLGTPLSSLMAWVELLRAQGVDESSLEEMNKDINRLNTITDRFSKIGSEVKLTATNVSEIVSSSIVYLQTRVSKKVQLIQQGETNAIVLLNESLMEWVIENITKNAIDAITGDGKVIFTITKQDGFVYIDIADTGKGIPLNKQKIVFQPGYTTKKRGWGLGLSLVKRIIEDQLKGKIIVKYSELGVGTTFRITLRENETP